MALPYFPLPAKMQAALLTAMTELAGESAATYGARVLAAMNDRMAEFTDNRKPSIGVRWR